MDVGEIEINCCLMHNPAFTVWLSLSVFHLAHQSFPHTILNSYVFLKGWEPTALPSLPLSLPLFSRYFF